LRNLAKNYPVDAVVVLNGSTQPNLNKLAENLAMEMGLPGVAGSDSLKSKIYGVLTPRSKPR